MDDVIEGADRPSSSTRNANGGSDTGTRDSAAANGLGIGGGELPRVLFDCTKRETHTPKSGFKNLYRRLRSMFKPEKLELKEDFTADALAHGQILVLGCPRERFSVTEFDALKQYVLRGGSILVFAGEGGEAQAGTNINYLLEEFGISINDDCVVRTVHYKYLHPKEVHIADGILNREVVKQAGKQRRGAADDGELPAGPKLDKDFDGTGLEFVYPHGATLTVQKPAVALLGTGKIAYPMQRPIAAVWSKPNAGRLVVMGSARVFEDKWLDKEENSRLMDFIFKFLKPASSVKLHAVDADDPDIAEFQHLPDTEALAERLRACLQEGQEVSRDWASLFDTGLFKLHTDLVPEVVGLYETLKVKKAQLSLIPPQFETPLPPLQPAVFPPGVREPPPPALDLFDLDEMFSSEHVRLAQLANKCAEGTEADLEFFVQEGCSIVGLARAQDDALTPQGLLAELFRELVEYKKSSSAGMSGGAYESAYAMGLGQTSGSRPASSTA
eukprot:CAMPEP_0177593220 /NCGR_PEP_ID=MMETSP0419_2-20121207/9015_1 /TAXON_ID=582737 /ORGANISM="Tetraselmis sp., Strain GSL018" /LENGTH=499 /DNA_ID=CAMNT_0019084215 /DNA_START=322 /DNA_END=1817 /DNA_ORIENTATION=-